MTKPFVPTLLRGGNPIGLAPSVDCFEEMAPLSLKGPWDRHVTIDSEANNIPTSKVPAATNGVKVPVETYKTGR